MLKLMGASLPASVLAVLLCWDSTAATAADGEMPLPAPGFAVSTERSDPGRQARPSGEPYRGDIIDVLTHVDPPQRGGKSKGKNPDTAIDQIAEANVAGAILEPVPNESLNPNKEDGTSYIVQLAKESGGRVRAFCGSDYLNLWLSTIQASGYSEDDLKSHLDRLDRDLGTGCAGLGEFALFHFNKSGFQNVIQLRATFPPVLAVIDVVARRGTWIQLHIEPVEPDSTSRATEAFGALALFYQLHPDLKVILSHTAMTNATNARRILTTYPKLMMTIKLVPKNEDWAHLEPVVNNRGELYEDWAKLMDDMPDRFMVGSDSKFASDKHNSGDKYPKTVELFRKVLGSLSPTAADAIANGNARRLIIH